MTLIKIEWRKVSRNRIFWAMLLIYFIALILAFLGLQSILAKTNENLQQTGLAGIPLLPTKIYVFPHVWHNITFVARFFKIFLAVVMIILVTNEYTYNTLRQNLITGLSRKELVISKIIDAIILSAATSLLILIFGLIAGFINSSNYDLWDIVRKLNYLAAYFMMSVGFLSFAMMLAFILRKAAFTIMVLLAYSYILELIPAFKFSDTFGEFLPLRSINLLIEAPNTPIFEIMNISSMSNVIPTSHIIATVVYTTIFWVISYLIVNKRDL